jgi:triacylglycerol lipase
MAMSELNPIDVVQAATYASTLRFSKVGGILDQSLLPGSANAPPKGTVGAKHDVFSTTTGGLWVLRQSSNFGYMSVLPGDREASIVTRGTYVSYDWLTDLNIGLSHGPTGALVHSGFMTSWAGFKDELDKFLNAHRNLQTIHCVGHSLGGALATLNAAYVKKMRPATEVKLYTIGCPRVGCRDFAKEVEHLLGVNNIKRTSNIADPVPMIAKWPFVHTPTAYDGIVVGGRTFCLISPSGHFMDTYGKLMGSNSWADLERLSAGVVPDNMIATWLEGIQSGLTVVTPGGAMAFKMLGLALQYLIKIAMGVVSVALTAGLTLIDWCAMLLERAWEISQKVGYLVESFMIAVMKFFGQVYVKGVNLTAQFLRYVLRMINQMVATLAIQAMRGLYR